LPTEKAEKIEGHENAAYDGGKDGRKVLDRFLAAFEAHLAPGGILLLLNSSVSARDGLSGNEETRMTLEKKGFKVEEVGNQAFFFEKLIVYKIVTCSLLGKGFQAILGPVYFFKFIFAKSNATNFVSTGGTLN
jgi:methylase of polypeptide subunit release factors